MEALSGGWRAQQREVCGDMIGFFSLWTNSEGWGCFFCLFVCFVCGDAAKEKRAKWLFFVCRVSINVLQSFGTGPIHPVFILLLSSGDLWSVSVSANGTEAHGWGRGFSGLSGEFRRRVVAAVHSTVSVCRVRDRRQ